MTMTNLRYRRGRGEASSTAFRNEDLSLSSHLSRLVGRAGDRLYCKMGFKMNFPNCDWNDCLELLGL